MSQDMRRLMETVDLMDAREVPGVGGRRPQRGTPRLTVEQMAANLEKGRDRFRFTRKPETLASIQHRIEPRAKIVEIAGSEKVFEYFPDGLVFRRSDIGAQNLFDDFNNPPTVGSVFILREKDNLYLINTEGYSYARYVALVGE